MSAKIIDGKAVAASIREELKGRVAELAQRGITPGLSVILVGDNPASQVYVRNKERACIGVGMNSQVIRMPETTTQEELLDRIDQLNADPSVHGILVQLPVPNGIDSWQVIQRIDPKKDVDGFHPVNTGALFSGEPGLIPCTPKGCLELIKREGIDIAGKNAVVVGRSNIVGKPMALLLLSEHATVTICHSRTKDLGAVTREADILVVAIGRAQMITGDMIKPGACVIDVGMNRLPDGKLCGDVDFASAEQVAGFITPVPGGVGPMTIAELLVNTYEACVRNG
ncbi:bifunctional methylenetetrahydrofolate dehydrogenase/methenyltetrahydrofolate cyclohydrolase FolD [Eubacteriales bacterium OttesenSCG-928-N13]|nr:bifunctional methylenetetrahydrofolate dehydrogenase/methenyltetrahydrofolate cyclohydrolase FolD [Eubacteriales bacterium OttesenSCG-928-N13]